MTILLALFAMHALCDFGLQNDYVANFKNPRNPAAAGVWPWVLIAHALIHSGGVLLVTHSWYLAIAELCAHWTIDYAKCVGFFGTGTLAYSIDQSLHYICKLIWWFVMMVAVLHLAMFHHVTLMPR